MSDERKEVRRVDVLNAISDLENTLAGDDEAIAKLAMIKQKVDDLSIVVYAASSAGEAIAVVQDTDKGNGVHTLVTQGYMDLVGLGTAQLAKTSWAQIVHREDIQKILEHYKRRSKDSSVSPMREARIISRTRGTIHAEINIGEGEYKGKPAYVVFLRDISRRREYEKRAMLVDKFKFTMEAVGGVAHDLGNLTGGFGLMELMELKDMDQDTWESIRQNAGQAMDLVRKLSEFAGGKLSETINYFNASDLASDAVNLVRREYEQQGITLNYHFKDGCRVYVQPVEFKRALHNLLVNAGEAIEEAESKQIPEWDGKKEVTFKGWREGDTVMFEISDTGIGLEDTTRIYLPKFSTKDKGRPSGMGLGMVYSTVVQNNGQIIHRSDGIGKGATCCIQLPYRSCK